MPRKCKAFLTTAIRGTWFKTWPYMPRKCTAFLTTAIHGNWFKTWPYVQLCLLVQLFVTYTVFYLYLKMI